jgi:TonB family protein
MKSRCNRHILSALLVLSVVPAPAQGKKRGDNQEALQLLDKARSLSDIRAPGSPPFRIEARVESAALAPGKPNFVGTWMLTWQSPSQWREEVGFPGFNQVRVASQGKLWTYRSVPYEPVRVSQLSQLVDFRSHWVLRSGQLVTALKEKKRNGISMRCVEVKGEPGPWRDLCADTATLLPVWVEPFARTTLSVPFTEYADYAPWGSRQFPRSMRAYEGSHLILAVQAQIGPETGADPSLFTPPAQAVEWDWCPEAELPRLLSSVPPHYPDAARQSGQEAVVSVYVVIEPDGTPGDLAVARSAGRDFDASTLSSVRQWRYRPAMCGSTPIPTETIVDVAYTLRSY